MKNDGSVEKSERYSQHLQDLIWEGLREGFESNQTVE